MTNINVPIRLPSKIKLYWLIQILLLLFIISIPIISYESSSFLILIIFIGLPLYFYLLLYYNAFTFVIDENNITINSGIIVKKTKTISFNVVQSIENICGISYRIFGLSKMKIWTSSPEQLQVYSRSTVHKPDIELTLTINDAEALKNFILDKKSK